MCFIPEQIVERPFDYPNAVYQNIIKDMVLVITVDTRMTREKLYYKLLEPY